MYEIFIASSNQNIEPATKFQSELMNLGGSKINVVGWWEQNKAFQNGDSTLESLLQISRDFDFAVIFLSPDYDREKKSAASSNGENNQLKTPSGNCIFELGIFASALSPKRCFVLCSVSSQDLVESLSDFRGINYFKVNKQELASGCRNKAISIKDSILTQGYMIDYEPIPLITMDNLKELEIRKTTKNNGNLIKSATVIVNSAQPLELDSSFTKRVKQNLDSGILYSYFFPAIDDNLRIVAELFQSLAASHLDSESPEEIKRQIETTLTDTENNLNQLRNSVSIYFLEDIQPIEFCIHNASSLNNAICYLRLPDNDEIKFVEWASQHSAYEIARNLKKLGKQIRGNKFIFHATKEIDIYSIDHTEFLQDLKNDLLSLFPQQLHDLVIEVCFSPNL